MHRLHIDWYHFDVHLLHLTIPLTSLATIVSWAAGLYEDGEEAFREVQLCLIGEHGASYGTRNIALNMKMIVPACSALWYLKYAENA